MLRGYLVVLNLAEILLHVEILELFTPVDGLLVLRLLVEELLDHSDHRLLHPLFLVAFYDLRLVSQTREPRYLGNTRAHRVYRPV